MYKFVLQFEHDGEYWCETVPLLLPYDDKDRALAELNALVEKRKSDKDLMHEQIRAVWDEYGYDMVNPEREEAFKQRVKYVDEYSIMFYNKQLPESIHRIEIKTLEEWYNE